MSQELKNAQGISGVEEWLGLGKVQQLPQPSTRLGFDLGLSACNCA